MEKEPKVIIEEMESSITLIEGLDLKITLTDKITLKTSLNSIKKNLSTINKIITRSTPKS